MKFILRSSEHRTRLLLVRRHSSPLLLRISTGHWAFFVLRRRTPLGSPRWQGSSLVPVKADGGILLDRLAQQKPHAFGCQPIAILYSPIVGLGIRQAEFGLVEKQGRGLQRLEATRFCGLATVVHALAVSGGLSWENARFVAATRDIGFPTQRSGLATQRRA